MADEIDDLIDTGATSSALVRKPEPAPQETPVDDGSDTADDAAALAADSAPRVRAESASARQSAPPEKIATGPSLQKQIVERNKGKFRYVTGEAEDDNPAAAAAEENRLLLTERFLNAGQRDAYLKADEKGREKIIKTLVRAEASEQAGEPTSKGYAQRVKALEAKLTAEAAGLAELADFQPDAPKAKGKKKEDEDVGLLRENAVSAATGVAQGAAGLVGVAGTVLGLMGGDETDRNLVGRFADGIRAFADEAIADYEKVRERNTSKATKEEREEWERIKGEGSNYEIAKAALTSPRMWAHQGTNMLGMLVPGLGAAGTAARVIGATSKLGKAAATGLGAAAAGGSVAEVDLAKYEAEIIKQGSDRHKEYVGWHDTKALLENARGTEVADEEVSRVMARQMRNLASKYDYALSTAVMLVGPVSVNMLGRKLALEAAEGYAGGIAKRAAKGGATEAAQEVGQQYGSNVAREAVRRRTEEGDDSELRYIPEASRSDAATEGLLDSAIMGGLLGAGVSAATRGKTKPSNDPQDATPVDELRDTLAANPVRPPSLPFDLGIEDARETQGPPTPQQAALDELRQGSQTPAFGTRPAPTPEFGSARDPRALDNLVEPEAPAFQRRPVDELRSLQRQSADSASRIAAGILQRIPENPTLRDVEQALGKRFGQTEQDAPDAPTEVLRDQVNSIVFDQVFRQRPRAIDAADENATLNGLDPDKLDEIAAGVAQQLADPGHAFVESVAHDTVAEIVRSELPDAPVEAHAELAANVQGAMAQGSVIRAPKEKRATPDKWSRRTMTDHLLDGATDAELANEIAQSVPLRAGARRQEAAWAKMYSEAMEAASKGQLTEKHRLVIKADSAAKLNPSRLGKMLPSIFTRSKASVGEKPKSHISRARAHQIASDYVNGAFKDLGLNAYVVRTHSEINPAFGDVPVNAKAFIHTDADGTTTVGLVADMLATEVDARRAMEHEVIGHYKLERVLGEKGMAQLVDRVYAGIHRDPQSSALWEKVKRDYPGTSPKDQVLEYVARVAEQPKDGNGGKVTLDGVRTALGAAGYRVTDAMSMGELKSLLAEVRAVKDPDYNPIASKDYRSQQQRTVVNPKEQVIRQSRLRKWERYFFDRSIDMQFMFRSLGVLNQKAHRMFLSMQSQKDRIVNGEIIENHVKPLDDALHVIAEKHGRTIDEIYHMANDWAQAKHAPEVNAWLRLIQAPLSDAKAVEQRATIINNALKGTLDPARARAMLDALVTDAIISDPKYHKASVALAGVSSKNKPLTDAEAAAELKRIPIAADLETLAGPNGELTRLRAVTKKYALSSGYYNSVLTDMAGYENYIPRKGTEYDDRATRPWQEGFSSINEKRGASEGRRSTAEHGVTQLMMEAQLMGGREVNQKFMRTLADAFDRPGGDKWARVGKSSEIKYGDGEFIYPEKPNQFMKTDFAVSDPDTGATRILTLKDVGVAEVLQNTYKTDDPANSVLRFVGASTRFMGRLYTSLSPSFMVTNIMRDVTGVLEAIATEDAKGDPSKRRVFNTGQLKNVAKSMSDAYLSGDMRELFMASQGEREVILQRWAGEDLLAKYGDADAAQRAQELRDHARAFVEDGGVIGFGRFVDPSTTFKATDELRGGSNVASRGFNTAVGYMESIGTFLDNAHRLGIYVGLKSVGVPHEAAMVRARTTSLDFNQRSGMRDGVHSQWFHAAFMFAQPSLTGLHALISKRMWRGGEIPVEDVDGPDGLKYSRLKAGWEKELNWPLATYLAAVGFATTMAASQMMGTDDDGEDRAKKLAHGSWFRNHVIAGPGDRPYLMPQQYGAHQIFSNIGTMIALRSLGYADSGELAKEYSNVLLQNTIPGFRFQVPEGAQNFTQMVMGAMLPSILQPAGQYAMNRNAFGQKIYDEARPGQPRYNSEMGRLSTPQAFSEVATIMRETTGLDLQPEVYAFGVQQLGWVGSTVVELGKWAQGNSDKSLYDVAKVGVRRDFSADGYQTREYRKFLETVHDPIVKEWERARKLDAEEAGTTRKAGKKSAVGPRERDFLDAHPEAPAIVKSKRSFDQATSQVNQTVQQMKAKGEGERAAAANQTKRDLVGEFLLRQKEGRLNGGAQDFDRFVRDRLGRI
jgi:hypothetical protein